MAGVIQGAWPALRVYTNEVMSNQEDEDISTEGSWLEVPDMEAIRAHVSESARAKFKRESKGKKVGGRKKKQPLEEKPPKKKPGRKKLPKKQKPGRKRIDRRTREWKKRHPVYIEPPPLPSNNLPKPVPRPTAQDDFITNELMGGIHDILGREVSPEHQLIRDDFHTFGRLVMGRKDMPFHTKMRQMIMEEQYCMFLLPRGYAKSTIVSVELPLWLLGKNRDLRIIIATNALRLGVEWLREIENVMANNSIYKEVYGNLIPESRSLTWTDTEKIVVGRTPQATHTSLYCVSVTGSTLGKRASHIIADDLMEPEKGVPTEGELRGIKEWFWKVLFPVLEPGGKIFAVGTRWHMLDLYGELMNRGWVNIVQSALVVNPETGEEESTWPERFSTKELIKRRESMGSIIFNLQYQNNADISSKLQMEFLHLVTEDNIPDDLVYYQGVDPCLAVGSNPDYFAIATIGVSEKTGKGYLVDLVRGRLGFHQQMDVIRQQANIWKPRKVGIETNAAQVFMKESMQEADFTSSADEEVFNPATPKIKKRKRKFITDIPLISVPAKGSKINRILAMSAMFESGLILVKAYKDEEGLLPIPQLEPFVSEWLTFPNSRNDDSIDACSICTRVAEFGLPKPITEMQEYIDDEKPYHTRRARLSLFHRR